LDGRVGGDTGAGEDVNSLGGDSGVVEDRHPLGGDHDGGVGGNAKGNRDVGGRKTRGGLEDHPHQINSLSREARTSSAQPHSTSILDIGSQVDVYRQSSCLISQVRRAKKSVNTVSIGGKSIISHEGLSSLSNAYELVSSDKLPCDLLSIVGLEKRFDFVSAASCKVNGNDSLDSLLFKDRENGRLKHFLRQRDSTSALHNLFVISEFSRSELSQKKHPVLIHGCFGVDLNADRPLQLCEKQSGFSKSQIFRARAAQLMIRRFGFKSSAQIKKIILRHSVSQVSNPINSTDIDRATSIYLNRERLNGVSTLKKVSVIVSDPSPYQEHRKIANSAEIDLFFVNNRPYVLTILHPLHYIEARSVKNKTGRILCDKISSIFTDFKVRGFDVSCCWTDGEPGIVSQRDAIQKSTNVLFQNHPPLAHASRSEIGNKVVKNSYRVIRCSLPYQLPISLDPYLIAFCCFLINALCCETRADDTPSREIMLERKLNVDKELVFEFGQFVTTQDVKLGKNSAVQDRVADSIYLGLCPSGSTVFLLDSQEVVDRTRLWPAVASSDSIDFMNALWAKQRQTLKGLPNTEGEWIFRGKVLIDNTYDIEPPISELEIPAPASNTSDPKITSETSDVSTAPALETSPPKISDDQKLDVSDSTTSDVSENTSSHDSKTSSPEISESTSSNDTGTPSPIHLPIDEIQAPWLKVDPIELATKVAREKEEAREKAAKLYEDLIMDDKQIVTRRLTKARDKILAQKHLSGKSKAKLINSIELYEDTNQPLIVCGLSVRQSIVDYGEERTNNAIIEEIDNLVNNKVFDPVRESSLSSTERKLIIGCKLFLKPKVCTSTSMLLRLKARIVMLGNFEDRESYDSVSSPAVAVESILTLLSVAAYEKHEVRIFDQIACFLQNDVLEGSTTFMKLNPFISKLLVERYEQYLPFLDEKGCFCGRLSKTCYGTLQASRQQFLAMKEVLVGKMNMTQSHKDPCIFVKLMDSGNYVRCGLYVDDNLTCGTTADLDIFEAEYRSHIPLITVEKGPHLQHLGVTLDLSKSGECLLSMKKHISKIVNQWKDIHSIMKEKGHTTSAPLKEPLLSESKSKSHSDDRVFKLDLVSDDLPKSDEDQQRDKMPPYLQEFFRSSVASCLYVARKCRFDIPATVAYLSTRTMKASYCDLHKLQRLISYLHFSKDTELVLCPKGIFVEVYVDASFACHNTCRSHTGCAICIGGCFIHARSVKQKVNSKSSCEAEVIAMSDSAGMILWMNQFLEELGYTDLPPVHIHEDNSSAITLWQSGFPRNDASKHLAPRYFFVTDLVLRNLVSIDHIITEEQIADLLTKGMVGDKFYGFRNKILNGFTTRDTLASNTARLRTSLEYATFLEWCLNYYQDLQ